MTIEAFVARADEALTAKRVFGEPVAKNGLTVIPVARIMGGVGGGAGTAQPTQTEEGVTAEPTGMGGGFGLVAQPAGVYVLKGEEVRWLPAIDVNRMLVGFQIVAVIALLTIRSIARARATARLAAA